MSDPDRSHALLFEAAPYHDGRPQSGWRWPGRRRAAAYLLLAVLLTAGLLLVPLGSTLVISLRGGESTYAELWRQGQFGQALLASVIWLAFAPAVCAVGAVLAWLARAAPDRLRVVLRIALVLPAVVSPMTTGVVFRLLFDAHPERGTVNALLGGGVAFLGPGWVWLVLFLAFAWQWTGVAFLLFQGGMARLPRDLLRMARAYGVSRAGRLWAIVVPAMAPAATLAYLIVLVAAARVFDLVLAGAPGSMLSDVGGLGLYWWLHNVDLGDGPAAALAVVMSAVVAAFALPALFGLRRG
ncbi:MAG: sugar ABC transporter permease, partial [Nonomuraea sp.]|nr:sugar ABC transporter permease [Nonomuraea sp.]